MKILVIGGNGSGKTTFSIAFLKNVASFNHKNRKKYFLLISETEGKEVIIFKNRRQAKTYLSLKDCIDKYPSEIIDMYNNLRKLIFDCVSCELEETLWAKLPSCYVGEYFVIYHMKF